jgi:hypothetical protein
MGRSQRPSGNRTSRNQRQGSASITRLVAHPDACGICDFSSRFHLRRHQGKRTYVFCGVPRSNSVAARADGRRRIAAKHRLVMVHGVGAQLRTTGGYSGSVLRNPAVFGQFNHRDGRGASLAIGTSVVVHDGHDFCCCISNSVFRFRMRRHAWRTPGSVGRRRSGRRRAGSEIQISATPARPLVAHDTTPPCSAILLQN